MKMDGVDAWSAHERRHEREAEDEEREEKSQHDRLSRDGEQELGPLVACGSTPVDAVSLVLHCLAQSYACLRRGTLLGTPATPAFTMERSNFVCLFGMRLWSLRPMSRAATL